MKRLKAPVEEEEGGNVVVPNENIETLIEGAESLKRKF